MFSWNSSYHARKVLHSPTSCWKWSITALHNLSAKSGSCLNLRRGKKKTWSIISNSPTSWTPDCCVRSACVHAGRLGSGTKEAAGSAARLHNQKPAGGFLQPTWDLPEDLLPWVLPKCCSRFPSSLEKLNYIQCVFIGRMKLYFPVLEIAMRDTFFS